MPLSKEKTSVSCREVSSKALSKWHKVHQKRLTGLLINVEAAGGESVNNETQSKAFCNINDFFSTALRLGHSHSRHSSRFNPDDRNPRALSKKRQQQQQGFSFILKRKLPKGSVNCARNCGRTTSAGPSAKTSLQSSPLQVSELLRLSMLRLRSWLQ